MSTATEVSSFAVEAGVAGAAASWSSRTVAGRDVDDLGAETPLPRAGAASSGVSCRLSAAGSGAGAVGGERREHRLGRAELGQAAPTPAAAAGGGRRRRAAGERAGEGDPAGDEQRGPGR